MTAEAAAQRPCPDCRSVDGHTEWCQVGRHIAAVKALTPAEFAAFEQLPYSAIPYANDAVRVVAAVRPHLERELREQIAREVEATTLPDTDVQPWRRDMARGMVRRLVAHLAAQIRRGPDGT